MVWWMNFFHLLLNDFYPGGGGGGGGLPGSTDKLFVLFEFWTEHTLGRFFKKKIGFSYVSKNPDVSNTQY